MNIVNEQDESLITLTLDMGASISKALYNVKSLSEFDDHQCRENKTYSMYMDSEMIRVPEKMVKDESFGNFVSTPENSAWIKLKAKDANVVAFGLLARKFQALKQNQIYSVKYENALDKCLAFIGAIIKKHNLNPLKINVIINLLIPYDEFKSREIIKNNISKSIKNFYFQNIAIKSKLVKFNCFPEGFGGFVNRVDSYGCEWVKDKKIAVLMIGHRNCTCLIFEKGNLFHGETIRTGFFDLIKDIQSNSIGQNINDLEYVVPKMNKDLNNSSKMISCLIKANNKKNQKNELEKIKTAIINSREKFWIMLSTWLDSQIPSYLNEIMIFGGASQYFQLEINQYYSWSNIYWAVDTANEIQKSLFSEIDMEDKLPYRFVDVFGLHKHISKK